jgi:hypothetical protein
LITDLEKIEVKHIRDGQIVDTFWAYPEITRRGENGEVSAQARIYREFDINDSYHFTVLEKQTFVLSDIKMGLHAGYTMFSEGYDCDIQSFKIDSLESDRLKFKKEGYE